MRLILFFTFQLAILFTSCKKEEIPELVESIT